ncbi:MAG: ATP synthase subunit I [Bacillota bacterium]
MKNKDIIEKTFIFSWPYAILFSLVVYIITKNFDFVLSFILGVATSLFMNSLNYKIMKVTYKESPNKIKSRQLMMYFAKLLFFGIILYITIKSDEYNEYYTFIGLLTFIIISIPVALIYSQKGDEEDA